MTKNLLNKIVLILLSIIVGLSIMIALSNNLIILGVLLSIVECYFAIILGNMLHKDSEKD